MALASAQKSQFSELRLAVIVIAAGNSSRLGQPKQLLLNKGQSFLNNTLQLALNISSNVTAVLGYNAELMSQQIECMPVNCVINNDWRTGMGTSIACAIESLTDEIDAVMILLCDQWALTEIDLQQLVTNWREKPQQIVASSYFETKENKPALGAPAIFPRVYFNELNQLRETGARFILQKYRQTVLALKLDNAAFDIDTPADLELFEQTKEHRSSQL